DNGHFSKLTPVSAAGDNSVTQRDKRVFIQFPGYTLYMKIFRTGVITLDSCLQKRLPIDRKKYSVVLS
ncbi:hypothetical protein, partial [Klebsiella pneumoniae]|uniref:hypothetical protein n=1 Tax=Klebsiella pneumoniae TaxID=573 RepID=UPI0039694BAA